MFSVNRLNKSSELFQHIFKDKVSQRIFNEISEALNNFERIQREIILQNIISFFMYLD